MTPQIIAYVGSRDCTVLDAIHRFIDEYFSVPRKLRSARSGDKHPHPLSGVFSLVDGVNRYRIEWSDDRQAFAVWVDGTVPENGTVWS